MNAMNNGGKRQAGKSGSGRGRMGGLRTADPVGNCLCPQCGHRDTHDRGIPCIKTKCPKCGAAMIRE